MVCHEADKDVGYNKECLICLKDEVFVVFLPCPHQILCVPIAMMSMGRREKLHVHSAGYQLNKESVCLVQVHSDVARPASLHTTDDDDFSTSELGLKKEHREMLPIIIFKETFSVKDTQCSVCLADYQAEDRLQQIPACGHTFHTDCIDLWLATHTTCPLCRLSLIASAKASTEPLDAPETSSRYHPHVAAGDETRSHQIGNRTSEESWISQQCSGSGNGDERSLEMSNGEERTKSEYVERERHLEALN